MQYRLCVDTASSQPGDLVLPATAVPDKISPALSARNELSGQPAALVEELWLAAETESSGLTREEFSAVLTAIGAKYNHGLPPEILPDAVQRAAFLRALRLAELALAHACALGREIAWQRFLRLYRAPLTQAAVAIAGSATVGHDLADSLYAELYGMRERDGLRRSPLSSYSGRGSLLGWLRTTLAQRHVDRHRRTYRETPLEAVESVATVATASAPPAPVTAELARLTQAVSLTLQNLDPGDRYLLAAYYLDRQTLLQIARILQVHEATVSRRLKRLVIDLRRQLLQNLQSGGLSKRAAEEAIGADPRDIEINLRALLQTSQTAAFSDKAASATTASSDQL